MENTKIVKMVRLSCWLYSKRYIKLAKLVQLSIRIIFSAEIPYTVQIGSGVDFRHGGLGVVLHKDVVIGNNAVIFQHVTIGGMPDGGVPKIGDNCYIGTGAVILGGITIGSNCKIGANTVVLKSIPDNSTVVGVLARIL